MSWVINWLIHARVHFWASPLPLLGRGCPIVRNIWYIFFLFSAFFPFSYLFIIFAAPLCNYALYFSTFLLGRCLWLFKLWGRGVANEGTFYTNLLNLSWVGVFGSRVIQALSQSKIQMLIILAWCRYQR